MISSFLSENSATFQVSKDDISWITSISFTSSIFSVLLFYCASSRFGRKQFLLCIASFYVIVWALILCTSSMMVILICFWLYGIASSTQYIIGYTYIGEVSNPRNRELLGATYCIATAVGTEVEYLISIFSSYRVLAIFPLVVSIMALFTSYLMVESPFYLVDKGDETQALQNLCYLSNKNEDAEALSDLQMVKEYVNEHKDNGLKNNLQIILTPSNLKITLIMILMNVLSVVHAAYLVSLTGSYVLKDFSASIDGDVFFNIFFTSRIFLMICSFYTVKRFDRKQMFLVGFPMTGLLHIICSICFYIESINGNSIYWLVNVIAIVLIAILILAALSFSIALEILKIEIFPYKMKEFYTSIMLFSGDWAAFALVKSYFFVEPIIGNTFVMAIYALINFVTTIMVYYFVPQTKNKTLLQIRSDVNPEFRAAEST
ncbi:hypothetical protein V9T40_011231 [Parthenolecanium corni]|uniref:Major facilitator superfamily (MFS) profile domain-containing protein n=1 Tax=Parthenolecanium corni TaxID=536013 RepID=A0AAN9T7I4_9HEMI